MILSFANLKGGVGKTTSAVSVAAALARSHLKVLLVDLDPQANAAYSVGVPAKTAGGSLAEVFIDNRPLREVLWETPIEGLDVAVAGVELSTRQLEVMRRSYPTRLLQKALVGVRTRYDFVVIDCPAGLDLAALMGLQASTAFIVPTSPNYLGLESLELFFQGLEQLPAELKPRVRLLGILLTVVDHRVRLTEEVCSEVRRRYGRAVFRTEIPINVRLAEAAESGRGIFGYQSWSKGAAAYSRLGAEMLRRARRLGLE